MRGAPALPGVAADAFTRGSPFDRERCTACGDFLWFDTDRLIGRLISGCDGCARNARRAKAGLAPVWHGGPLVQSVPEDEPTVERPLGTFQRAAVSHRARNAEVMAVVDDNRRALLRMVADGVELAHDLTQAFGTYHAYVSSNLYALKRLGYATAERRRMCVDQARQTVRTMRSVNVWAVTPAGRAWLAADAERAA